MGDVAAAWQEYRNEVFMNCSVMKNGHEQPVPIEQDGWDALQIIFETSFGPLIAKEAILWVPDYGAHTPEGIARSFILATAAAIGRFGARCFGEHGHIGQLGMEVICEALVKDWEKVCPLPIAKAVGKTSCPIGTGIIESRKRGYPEPAHAGA